MRTAPPSCWGEGPVRVVWQLYLLLWKNLLVTQLYHHYIITAIELLLPALLSYLYGVLELDFSNALPAKEDGTRRRTLRDAFLVYWSSEPEPYFPADMIQKTATATKPPVPSKNATDEKVNLLYKEGLSGHVLASLPFVLMMGMPLPGFAYRVSMELNSGVKELMEAYGVTSTVYWLGNLLVELVKLMLIAVSVTLLWSYTELFKGTATDVQLLLLAFFFASSLALCLLIASFATRPGVAALSVVVMTLTTTLLPVVSLVGYSVEYIDMTRMLQLLSCLVPDVALTYAFTIMHINEELGGHLITLENMRNFVLRDVSLFKMAHAMMATLGGCLVLTMYVDRVWPGGDSFPERPLFFVDPDYWGMKYQLFSSTPSVRRMSAEKFTTEPVPPDLQPFVVLHKLSKNVITLLRSVPVLNKVSMKMYAEHVTVLLGTNGSGKSLILKIVSGLSRPHGGTVCVGSGYDVRKDLWHIRHLLGYCPQTDALLDELSIEENLFFFARLRRMGRRKAASEAQISLYEFQLFNRRKERVRHLKYSDRRRLQLAIAMVGSPAYLLLDEPTVGVDLETKHSLWEMILKARQRCGILLVTNSIEEAELLGDRIAIISQGDVACCGSSIYLRKRHGSGYRFPILMEEESDVSEVTAFIQRIRPSAEVYMERRRAVVYTIGYPGTTSLIDLLRELETNQKKLGITRIGVNAASLEDVMLRVHSEKSEFLMDDGAHSTMSRLDMQGRTQAVASTLFIRQVDALARKKFASGRRILGMHVILVSIQLVIVGFMVAYVSSHYPFVQMHRLHTVGNALDTLRVISVSKGRDFFLSLDFDRLSQEMHAVVLKVRLMVGALLPVAMALSISMRVFLPLQERKSEAKHLQLMTGLSPARYWTITFLIDMVYHVFTTLILLTPFFIPTRSDTVCQTFTYMGPFFSLIFMFGWSFVPITYLTSFMTDQRIAGYVTLVFSAFFFGSVTNSYMDMVGPSTVSKFRPSSWTSEISELLMVPLRLLPQYAVAHGASEVQASFSEHAACCRLHRALLWYICTVPLDSYPEAQRPFASRIMHCCQADCRNGSECVTMEPLRSPWNVLSSGWDLLMMFLSGILYLAAAVSLEKHLGLHHYLKPEPHLRHHVPTQLTNVETRHPSVTEEAEIVNKLITGEKTGDNPHHVTGLVVSELCLKTCGLGPLSFHVEQGEVFGIIGTEGSGRSSLLAAIAGEEALTKGSLLFNGASSTVNKAEYQRQIGYCPKNNPMVTRLTSHEMLQLIARLRGLPSTAIEEEVSFIEGKVGLRNVRDERVDKLRPCDKRKLSVGLALVGSPKLVILNECTREIDPMSRGRLFRCIEKMHSCAQTSMVFASHCLRECDSFCDRVAVLESGEFQVIGETSLLKEGCKQRFTVTVRLTKDKVQEGDYIKTVNRVMKEQFPSSLISDIRMDMLQYTVKDTAIPWSDVFVRMEKINDELNLEDYVVCEASLADVFLGFSHERKVVDFSGADMRIYSDSEPIEVFSDVPPTPTLLRQ